MNYTVAVILSFTIIFPAVAGWVRFNRMDPAFHPFVFLIWCGLANEIISFLVTRNGHSNALNTNLYAVVEGVLITLFFYQQKLFQKDNRIFYSITILLIAGWITDKLIISNIRQWSSYFSILAYFLYVLMSISMLNRLLLVDRQKLVRNSLFVICLAMITFFTYALLVEIFLFYGLASSRSFRLNMYRIMTYINVITNLFYTLAIVWIPLKRESTLLSSSR